MRNFLIFLIMIVLCTKANAATWVQIKEKAFIDLSSIDYYVDDYGNIDYDKKIFWMKNLNDKSENYKKLEKILGKKIWYTIDKFVINHRAKKIALISSTSYSLNEEVIDSFSNKDYELYWNDIIPDSYGEFIYEAVKSPKKLERFYKMQLMEKDAN